MNPHPLLTGLLNALLPGIGYLIVGERRTFGILMLAGVILFSIVMLVDTAPVFDQLLFAETSLGRTLETISYALIALAFGYDAYALAHEKRARVPVMA